MGPPREKQVALSAFALVFSELVQYQMTKIRSSAELEMNLEKMGTDIGKRVLDALFYRERLTKRELTEVGILQFITTTCWKALWGKSADSLERSTERDDEYMIVDGAPLVNQFVSVPANLGALDCAAFMAGVVAGLLDGAFFAAQCTAHPRDEGGTVFLIRIGHEDTPAGGDARSDVAALVAALDERVGAGHAAPPGGGEEPAG
jgi:hypothetical protein